MEKSPRSNPACRAVLYFVGAILLWSPHSPIYGQLPRGAVQGPAIAPQDDNYHTAVLAADRLASRGLRLARRRIEKGEFGQAIDFLDRLLAREEDAFVGGAGNERQLHGLKSAARRMIGELPPKGRDAYLLACAARARNALKSAVELGDLQAIRDVARRYFHTPAGFEATMILARNENDHGRTASAAALYQQLIDTPAAARRLGPQLYVLVAAQWFRAGRNELAKDALDRLKREYPGREVTIAGVEFDLFDQPTDALERLVARTGSFFSSTFDQAVDWMLFRGGPSRNETADGGMPHLNLRWRARVANDHHVERVLDDKRLAHERRGLVRLPAVHPLAVGDVVVMRTTNAIIGVDFQTGRRLWAVRPNDEEPFDKLVEAVSMPRAGSQSAHLVRALEQRMWADVPYGMLSSDGKRIYGVRGLPFVGPAAANPFLFGNPLVRRRRGGWAAETEESVTNILSAFELRTEGKRVWEINGAEVNGPLAGAFFLGPPLPIDGRLYVLAEIKSGIHLATLEGANDWPFWRLDWIQQLANLEIGIGGNQLRRLSGATPSYQDGVIVCPTTSGAAIAVDPIRRSLLWAYRYASRLPNIPRNVRRVVPNRLEESSETLKRWVDGSITIEAGNVFLTPPDSDECHCVDLATGELLWKRPRQDGLFLAAVHDGIVLIVGDRNVRSVRVADGEPAWGGRVIRFSKNVLPAGRGFLAKGQYFLPLSSREVIAIDISAGTITARAESVSGDPLGNLICHRGKILSQNERFLDNFDQLDVLERQTEIDLKRNENDPNAHRSLAEIEFNRGNVEKSLVHLRRAYEIAPDDIATTDLLVNYLLEALETDYIAHRDDLPLVERLVADSDQRWRLERVRAAGLERTGDVVGAARVYLRLARENQRSARRRDMSPEWNTPTVRWIRAQLTSLHSNASHDEQRAIAELLLPIEQELGDDPSIGAMNRHVNYFAGVGRGEALELLLASKMVSLEPGLNVEFLLLHLAQSTDATIRGPATALLAELLHSARRHEAAAFHNQVLATDFSDIVCIRGQTGLEIANAHQASHPTATSGPLWPIGSVTHQVIPIPKAQSRQGLDRFHGIRREGPFDPVLDRYYCLIDQHQRQNARGTFVLQDPFGHNEVVVPLSADEYGWRTMDLRGKRCHAVSAGGLIVVSFGDYLMAVDALDRSAANTNRILWGTRITDGLLESRFNILRQTRNRTVGFREFGQNGRYFATGADKFPMGVIGPVTRHGVTYQSGGRLICVDPLTGRTQWSRGDMPIGCLLFGDDEHLVVLPPGETSATVVRMLDGKRMGERSVPPVQEHLVTDRSTVLCWRANRSKENEGSDARPAHEMILYDVVQEATVWSREFSPGAKLCLANNRAVGVVEPAGRFQLIELATGDRLIDQRIEKEPLLDKVFVMLSKEDVLLVTSRPGDVKAGDPLVFPVGDTDFPIVTGNVYMFDRQTGEPRWSSPAAIRRQGFARWQPRELPIIAFVSNVNRRERGTIKRYSKVLCLDRTDGRAVLYQDDLKHTPGRCRIKMEPDANNRIMLELSTQKVEINYTNIPRPPEPPFDENVEIGSPRKTRGIMNLLRSLR